MFHPVKTLHTLYNLILFGIIEKPWIISFPTIYDLWALSRQNLRFAPFNQNRFISQHFLEVKHFYVAVCEFWSTTGRWFG